MPLDFLFSAVDTSDDSTADRDCRAACGDVRYDRAASASSGFTDDSALAECIVPVASVGLGPAFLSWSAIC